MSDTAIGNCDLILTNAQMRMADQITIEQGDLSGAELMQRAGAAIAQSVIHCCRDGGRIVVVVGPGNNGGDGFMAASLLRRKNIPVTVIPVVPLDQIKGDAAVMVERCLDAGVKIRPAISNDDLPRLKVWLSRSAIIVDSIFGTGLTRPLEGWFAEVVNAVNESDRDVFAVDIASGIHGDSGEVLGVAIKADFTLPVSAYKWGHWLNGGHHYAGAVLSPALIGISDETLREVQATCPAQACCARMVDQQLIKQAFPPRKEDSHKGDFGKLWIFGGSRGYTGAPRLAAKGALAIGTGLISIACPRDVYPILAASSLEVMVHPQEDAPWKGADAVVAGPGWGRESRGVLTELLRSRTKLVLDADALNMLADDPELASDLQLRDEITVITPHPGEAGKLLGIATGEIQKDRLTAALALVKRYKAWVVLKGSQTLVVSPERHVWLTSFGSSRLAVAGTGDVLAGITGGLLARGIAPDVALPAAVGLHALAGEERQWHRAGQMEAVIARLVRELGQ
ncbi:MAG: NAD(P)H-hydrate dehydratase [Mariprofundaceae bacterium]|nr:NAD(P)H-hydrate dehydratase [Mariprofundaceae bacterium]